MSRAFRRDGSWWIDFNDANGVRRRKKIGPSKRVAKEVLNGILGNVARRQHLGVISDSAISLSDFATKVWWTRIRQTLRPRTQERWVGIVEQHLKPNFPKALRAITKADAENYLARRLEAGAAASTVNREMTVLKHMLTRAVRWDYLGNNPTAGLKALREPAGRTRFLSIEEIARLMAACDVSESPFFKPFVIVAMNTGMRRNEILSLTRRTVDFANRLVTLTDTKNGSGRHVYLNDAAFESIQSLPARLDGRIFPLGPNQTTMLFCGRQSERAEKIAGFTISDIRSLAIRRWLGWRGVVYRCCLGIRMRG
jgi:integrase